MDTSLYLLFKAIREHSTVALSGESADEVFGGYRWFHDPSARAPTPSRGWRGAEHRGLTGATVLAPRLDGALDLPGYPQDRYRRRWPGCPPGRRSPTANGGCARSAICT